MLQRLVHAIGKINDDLIYNAVNDVKAGKKATGSNGEPLQPVYVLP